MPVEQPIAPPPTKTHSFTLYLDGADLMSDENFDALMEAGCDDATLGVSDGAQYAAFDREAPTFAEALRSAVEDVTTAVPGVSVVHISPDELVTMASIAERAGVSRESIRLLSTGKRGPGGFPAPITYADHRTRLWQWADVARWLAANNKTKAELDIEAAELVLAMNAALSLEHHFPRLTDADRKLVSHIAGTVGSGVTLAGVTRGSRRKTGRASIRKRARA
jgi:hypothetical protein